ncbi:MAG: YtxH domain-containing protein [Desulfurivibrio sp.]|nr:YtxH domain-containing protein [Desulfurivibrio sp.]
MTHHHDNDNTGLTVLSFFAGAVTGAAVALLVAPKSGRETRELLSNYGDELRERCRSLPEDFKGQAGEAAERGRAMIDQGKKLIERGNDLASQGKDYFEQKKKTLSAAVEAGRQTMAEEKEALDRALEGEEK